MNLIVLPGICLLFYLAIKLTDSKPNKVQYYYRWFSIYISFFLLLAMCYCVFVWKGRDIRNLPKVMKILRPLTRIHGITWHLENFKLMDTCSKAVIISNHQSSLDILGVINASPNVKKLILTSKKELRYWWPLGHVMYLTGTFFIDRRNTKDAYETLQSAVEIIKKNEAKLWLFPEGTRNNHQSVNLLPFKKGAFYLAVASQSPIIPVVISSYYFAKEDKPIFHNGGQVIMRCLEPVPTTGLTSADVPALTDRLHAVVLNAYEELSAEVMHRFPDAAHLTEAGNKGLVLN